MVLSLLVGAGVFLVSLVCFAMTTTLIVNLALHLIHSASGFWKSVAIMMIVSLFTAAAHLIQIALWAIVYLICGEVVDFNQAFYCSAQNYTALVTGTFICLSGGNCWAHSKRSMGCSCSGSPPRSCSPF